MKTKAQTKKAKKAAHKVRMRVKLRTKSKVLHAKPAKPRKRDRVMASVPKEERKSVWKRVKDGITSKMKARKEAKEAKEKAEKEARKKGVKK